MSNRLVIRICSFIPDAWIFFAAFPLAGVQKIEFEGDDRSFTPFTEGTGRFRTAQEFEIDFGQRSVTYHGETGVTKARIIWRNGQITEYTDQVSSDCLTFTGESWGTDTVTFRAGSGCANPLIPGAPSADYDLTIRASADGRVLVTGKHDGFPALEVYKQRPQGVFTALYLFHPDTHGKDMLSLMPPMDISVDEAG